VSELVLTAGYRRARVSGWRRPVTWARCAFCEDEYRARPSDLEKHRGHCSQACAELAAMLGGFVETGGRGNG
jgi:hypothetical protein